MINLILSGGSGTRLWPISRTRWPKQFYPLIDGASLFTLTVRRNGGLCSGFLVVTNFDQYPLAQQQLLGELGLTPPQSGDDGHGESHGPSSVRGNCILEPVGRNTAPAIALACLSLPAEELVLVTPSDHLITKPEAYARAVEEAQSLAMEGYLVTFGIEPTYPETGFGYIEANGREVVSFREKPDRPTAESYLRAGGYFWNSGMFCFSAGAFLSELHEHAPEVYRTAVEASNSLVDVDEMAKTLPLDRMMQMPDISIDYGIMEKSRRVKVVPADLGWSDLGSFDALYDLLPRNAEGNSLNPNARFLNSHNNLLLNDSAQLIVLQGVDDLMVVHTDTATFVGRRGESQHVKQVVDLLKTESSPLLRSHALSATLFGSVQALGSTGGEPIAELRLNPGRSCTLHPADRLQLWLLEGEGVRIDNEILAAGAVYKAEGQSVNLNNIGKGGGMARLLTVGEIARFD